MKPNLRFLARVKSGDVYRVRGYTMRKGGYTKFIGGESTWQRHHEAGFVTRPGIPDLGRPARVELTDSGRRALGEQ